MTFLLLLLIFEVLALLYAFALSKNDIMAPSVLMCIMFMISTTFALLNYKNWNILYDPRAFMLIIGGLAVFILSETVVRMMFKHKNEQVVLSAEHGVMGYSGVHCELYMLILIALFNLVISYWFFIKIRNIVGVRRISFSAIISIYRSLSNKNKENAGDNMVGGIIVQFLKIVKASGYVSGFALMSKVVEIGKRNNKSSVSKLELGLLIVIVLTSLFPSIMTAGRADILKFASSLVIEYYILWHQKNGWHRNLSTKYMRVGIVGVVGGIFLFYYSLSFLGRSTDMDLFAYTSIYLGSSIQLFNLYVQNPRISNSWGEESLVGIHKILSKIGLVEPSKFSNLEFRVLSETDGASNIYTFFRRPLHDFGVLGMFVFTALVAVLFASIYYGMIKNRERSIKTDCWTLVYGYLYYWIVASSMLQYSGAYISFGTVSIIVSILLIFLGVQKIRIKIKS